jgi:glycosyltransferase involved in cell wall biosynthesis
MWICCQLGAREHYSIPRAVHSSNELGLLATDAWADTWLPWRLGASSRAAERFHPQIPSNLVDSFDWSLLAFEFSARRRAAGWETIIDRNDWFQERTVDILRAFKRRHPNRNCTLFSYSYTARKPFEFAKEAGWSTVLGQIDPGPFEERLVADLHRSNGVSANTAAAPASYWDRWREECELADRIIVNSDWARHGLCTEGIAPEKLRLVPLVYDPPREASTFVRRYPVVFNAERPLRVLFLGQVNLRKGAAEIMSALTQLGKLPVELWFVGPVQLPLTETCREHPRVKWFGTVPRGAAASYYRGADVFLFPTFSDGFGLTQLEAQAWELPVIASSHCGDVVRHLENGYILPDVSAGSIVNAIRRILDEPGMLPTMAARSRTGEFAPHRLAASLAGIRDEL